MNRMEQWQLAFSYARRGRGVLESLRKSLGRNQVEMAVKSGRDEAARLILQMARDPEYIQRYQVEMEDRLNQACFGNQELMAHYGDQLQAFVKEVDCNFERAMEEIGDLYQVKVPRIDGTDKEQIIWDACIVQNPEMASVSPYHLGGSYTNVERESRLRLHEFLSERLLEHDFSNQDVCKLMLEDKSLDLSDKDYKDMVSSFSSLSKLLPPSLLHGEEFRQTLVETNPILALRTIPNAQQTERIRLLAISKDAEAYRWIDDDEFKRRHFTMDEMMAMRIGATPTPQQREMVQEKSEAMYKAVSEGDLPKMKALAEQTWQGKVDYTADRPGGVPTDFSESAKFHFHDGVTPNEDHTEYDYYKGEYGYMTYERENKRFFFTDLKGQRLDMTDSLEVLRQANCPFGSLTAEQQKDFVEMRDFAIVDPTGRTQTFVAQQSKSGAKSFISKISDKAIGKAMSVATGKAMKLWDDAMSAGQM